MRVPCLRPIRQTFLIQNFRRCVCPSPICRYDAQFDDDDDDIPDTNLGRAQRVVAGTQ